MNDKALYQLERAVDALKLMAEALREEQRTDNISINTGDVVFPTAWHDDVISFGEDYHHHGNIEITTGTEGNITFS
jgi:hypothetical protein